MSSHTLAKWAGPAVFLLAFALRLVGIGWGLPDSTKAFSLHPDEPVILGVAQQIDLAHGKLDPGFYNYGTFYLTLVNVATKVVDAYHPPAGPPEQAQREQTRLYHLAGRLISAMAGAGLAWVVLLMGRRAAGDAGGLFAGLAIAFSPVLNVHSRFQTVDMVATLFAGLALWFAVKALDVEEKRQVWKLLLGAALFAGLSAGTKYSGVLALTAPLTAIFISHRSDWLRLTAACAVVCFAAFCVGTPGLLLNPSQFWTDFRYEMLHTSTGHGLVFAETPSGFLLHLGHLVWGMGGLLALGGLIGLGVAAWRREKWVFVVAPFFLLTYLLIGRAEVKFIRYAFPLMPVVAAGFGYLIGNAIRDRSPWSRAQVALGIFALGGLGGGGLASTAVLSQSMAGLDPRDEAAAYLREHAAGRTVGLVSDPWFYTVTLHPFVMAPRGVGFERLWGLIDNSTSVDAPRLDQRRIGPQRKNWDIELLTETRPDFVTYSSFEANDIERILARNPGPDPEAEWNRARAFLGKLKEDYVLDRAFAPEASGLPVEGVRPDPLLQVHDVMYIRPTIWVWKRKTPS